jgi:hypothetical protein
MSNIFSLANLHLFLIFLLILSQLKFSHQNIQFLVKKSIHNKSKNLQFLELLQQHTQHQHEIFSQIFINLFNANTQLNQLKRNTIMPRSDFLKIQDNVAKTRTPSKGSKSENKPTSKKKPTKKTPKAITAPDVVHGTSEIVMDSPGISPATLNVTIATHSNPKTNLVNPHQNDPDKQSLPLYVIPHRAARSSNSSTSWEITSQNP